jgi:hypothetical protein
MSVERAAMKAIQIEAFGDPAEVVKVVNIPDIGAPAAGEVVIALEASPINRGARPISKAGGALDHACIPRASRTRTRR